MHIHSPREHAWLKGAQLRIAHWRVKDNLSSQRHVSSLAALVTEHFSARSLTYFTYLPTSHNLVLWNWIHEPCEIHGGVADLLKSHLPQVTSSKWSNATTLSLTGILGTDPYQTPERILGDHCQNPFTEDTNQIGKVGVEMPYVQSRIHSDYDSAESIADSALEDGEIRKMLASLRYVQVWGNNYCSSH